MIGYNRLGNNVRSHVWYRTNSKGKNSALKNAQLIVEQSSLSEPEKLKWYQLLSDELTGESKKDRQLPKPKPVGHRNARRNHNRLMQYKRMMLE